jgi:hypothetical protein
METAHESLSSNFFPKKHSGEMRSENLDSKISQHRNRLGTHPDNIEFKWMSVPLIILGHKFDKYMELQPVEKRQISQILRSYAHLYGASLCCSASSDEHAQCAKKVKEVITNYIYDDDFMNVKIKTTDYYIRPFFIKHGNDSIKDLEISMKSHDPLFKVLFKKYSLTYGDPNPSNSSKNDSNKPKFDQYPEKDIDFIREKKNRELQSMIQFKKTFNQERIRDSLAEKEEMQQSLFRGEGTGDDEDYRPEFDLGIRGGGGGGRGGGEQRMMENELAESVVVVEEGGRGEDREEVSDDDYET